MFFKTALREEIAGGGNDGLLDKGEAFGRIGCDWVSPILKGKFRGNWRKR